MSEGTHAPSFGFEGKRILVTGASSGLGKAIAIELSRHGAVLILVGRNREALEDTRAELTASPEHDILELDLRDQHQINPRTREAAQRGGPIYGFCHSAGVVDTRPLQAASRESIQAILDVNLLAGLELARAVSRRDVLEPNGGSLLFISSIYALIGMPGETGYSASKGAVISAVRTLAVELARRRIRVNALSPGFVRTAMTERALSKLSREQSEAIIAAHPLGMGTPEDVARAAAFLLAPVNGWITGTNLVIDGGFTAR